MALPCPKDNEIRRSAVMSAVSHYLAAALVARCWCPNWRKRRIDLIYDQYGMEVASEHFGAQDPLLILTPDWKVPCPKYPFSHP